MKHNHKFFCTLATVILMVSAFFNFSNNVFAGTTIGQASVSHPVYGIVNGNNVNVRAQPSTSSNVVFQVNSGTYVMIVGTSGDFYKIRTNPNTAEYAFIYKQYVNECSASCPGYVQGTGSPYTNVRATPNTSYAAIGRIYPGERAPLIVTSKFNINWYHIVWPMQTGYVSDTASVAYIY